jgi:hypothetical protein
MTIENVPSLPNRNQAGFSDQVDTFITWFLETFPDQFNADIIALNLNSTIGTSSTSNSIGTGAKTFTANTAKSWQPGMFLTIADTAAPSTNYMLAQVTSYNSGTGALVVNVTEIGGSGTKTAWTISQSSYIGPGDGDKGDIIVSSSGGVWSIDADSIVARHLADAALGFALINGTIVTSRTGNAETIAIKTKAGTDPTATDPVLAVFRNATSATGDYDVISITSANSITISSGSTLGMSNATAARIWLAGFNDAGTFRLGVVNTQTATGIFPLGDEILASSTAEGGAGAADSAGVIYTGTAVSSKALRILGYLEYTLATAGTWVTAPTKVQLYGPGVRKPGERIQSRYTQVSAVATGTTIIPRDDTIPQITEGDEYMTLAITPTSPINYLEIETQAFLSHSSATHFVASALFQDAVADALTVADFAGEGPGRTQCVQLGHIKQAGSAVAQTYRTRCGANVAGTVTFNGSATARLYGATPKSYMRVEEVMA